MIVLGVSMSAHDRSAALLEDGSLRFAIGEERIDRRKRSNGAVHAAPADTVLPPFAAIRYVLAAAKRSLDDVDIIVCGRSIKSARHDLCCYIDFDPTRIIEPSSHHLAHAYSAAFSSPFDESAVLVLDEQGTHCDSAYERASIYQRNGCTIETIGADLGTQSNISLGMFFDFFAGLLGLWEAGLPSAGKLMALGARRTRTLDHTSLIHFDPHTGALQIEPRRIADFLDAKGIERPILQRGEDVKDYSDLRRAFFSLGSGHRLREELAQVAQFELERAVSSVAEYARRCSGATVLDYAGGVALNCVANSSLREIFEDVHIHPAATDDGTAVGLAYYGYVASGGIRQPRKSVFLPYLGKSYSREEIDAALGVYGLRDLITPYDPGVIAIELSRGDTVCWFEGRSEWGPRALGARSILGDARCVEAARSVIEQIKHRESYRPLAIIGRERDLAQVLELDKTPHSLRPYMLAVAKLVSKEFEHLAHIDQSIRFQCSDKFVPPRLETQLDECARQWGRGILINTSFNFLGEPLVETPCDAIRQFLISAAPILVLDGSVLRKRDLDDELLRGLRQHAWRETGCTKAQASLSLLAKGFDVEAIDLWRTMDNSEKWRLRDRDEDAFYMAEMYLAENQSDRERAARWILAGGDIPSNWRKAAKVLLNEGVEEGLRNYCTALVEFERLSTWLLEGSEL